MARWEFKLPDVGEGVSEGEIVAWLVKAGDVVAEDQPIVEVMTDKATVTMTAPKSGVVVETRGRVGEIVPVHCVLVVFELDGARAAPPGHSNGRQPHPTPDDEHAAGAGLAAAATAVGELRETLPGMAAAGYFNDKPLATPATRKLARDMAVDLRRVPPSGPAGRVTRADVEGFQPASEPSGPRAHGMAAAAMRAAAAANDATAANSNAAVGDGALPDEGRANDGAAGSHGAREQRVPLVGVRRRIAQRMAQSMATAAHSTFVEECDATALKGLRGRLKDAAEARGVKLSFLPFVVKAVVGALKKHPTLNTTLDEGRNEIVFRKYFHIGIAAATDAGLVVPVVRDADKKSILEIAREIERLAREVRAGKAKAEDLTGSTFTITSLGTQGGLLATPIINFPEVAILGVHQMKVKPVVRDGQIVIGDVMLLSLTFDHRIVDGHVGAAFALDVIAYLEKPETLLLELA